MWYGAIPSAAVIVVCMSLPNILLYFENKYIYGNPYRRFICNNFEVHTYLRDMRLGKGDPYNQLGLDCLCPEKEECDCS